MALHDTDKKHGQRANPTINSDDGVINRMAHNTLGNTHRTAGSDVVPRMVFKNGLILTYDADDNISSVFGYVPELSSVPVLVIAKEGLDVYVDILGITPPVV